ncbi:hypothetical protein [Prescottella equi]
MTSKDWARATTKRVADQIQKHRDGMTVQALSDRTEELGYRISRSRISDLERGDRGGLLGAVELLVLAAALRVPPVQLLFPDLPDGDVEVLPGVHLTSEGAADWLSGLTTPALDHDHHKSDADRIAAIRELDKNAQPIKLTRRRSRLHETAAAAGARASRDLPDSARGILREQVENVVRGIREVEDDMRLAGLTVRRTEEK